MKHCKSCGKAEWGYASLLNKDGYCWKCANEQTSEQIKEKYKEILDKTTDIDIKINILTYRINELERIVQNQPLIKKYQKTLDIFLKNAQD